MIDENARERFAAVHLAGSLEAAVYETLAGVPSLAWTRAELAAQLHADVALVHVALRQFAAARIVDVSEAGADSKYRWRPLARFLGDEPSGDVAQDPVCDMWVPRATRYTLDTGAGTKHFCSQRCLSRWQRQHP